MVAANKTGASSAVCSNRLSRRHDFSEPTTMRVAVRGPGGRAVSCGSSASSVPAPTNIPSTRPRIWWTIARDCSLEIHRLSPFVVAIFPSKVIAHFATTQGRFASTKAKYGKLISRASCLSTFTSTAMPASLSCEIPLPATCGNGSS